MAGSSRQHDKVAEIAALASERALTQEHMHALREAIGSGRGLLVAAAAKVARKRMLTDLSPDLIRAFDGLLRRPARADKGCLAKAAVVAALNAFDAHDEQPFLQGVKYKQPEPAYGGMVDTAAMVRAECAIGLARMGHPQAAKEILPLLVDSEPEARAAGARALAYLGGQTGELLLRMKALVGDEYPAVVGECLSGLVKMDPAGSAEFVADFLESPDAAIVEEAAMAVAGLQDGRAAQLLWRCRRGRTDQAFREMLLVPMAMTRCDEAMESLCEVIMDEPMDSAIAAVKAAAMNRYDPRWHGRIGEAVRLREDAAVAGAYENEFGEGEKR